MSLSTRFVWPGVLLSALGIFAACRNRPNDKAAIIHSFEEYKRTTAQRLGTEAVKYVDSATLRYYEDLIPVVIHADSVTVRYLRYDQKIMVLVLRHTTPLEKLRSMNGSAVFQYIIQLGMVSDEEGMNKYRYEVSLPKGSAEGSLQFVDSTGVKGAMFRFRKEHGVWKLNLTSAFRYLSDDVWQEAIANAGITEDELIHASLMDINGKEPRPGIWRPMTDAAN